MSKLKKSREKPFHILSFLMDFSFKFILWALSSFVILAMLADALLFVRGEKYAFSWMQQLNAEQVDFLRQFKGLSWVYQTLSSKMLPLSWMPTFEFKTPALLKTAAADVGLFSTAIVKTQSLFSNYFTILLLSLQLGVMRFLIFCFALPLFLLTGMVGCIDGFVARALRRYGGARESALLYHRSRNAITLALFIPFFLYLSLPISLNPAWFFIPSAFLFGFALFMSIRNFKKYV